MSETPDLNLLLVFEAMFRHGSVTRAAAQIGLTQSAMSSALGRLRRQFGDPLFVNTRSGMLPTPGRATTGNSSPLLACIVMILILSADGSK